MTPEPLWVLRKVTAGDPVAWDRAVLPAEPWAPGTGHPPAQVTHKHLSPSQSSFTFTNASV